MLKIYHNDKMAIVADEYSRTYKEVSKKDAVAISKGFESRVVWYESLEGRRNVLVGQGYKKIS